MGDPVVLNYQNSLLRQSDVDLLTSPNWLNDTIIAFSFEYFEHSIYHHDADKVGFVCPQVVQYLKCGHSEDIQSTIEELELNKKDFIFFPVNDCQLQSRPGGTHWSLLVFNAHHRKFEHYDSYQGSSGNSEVARDLANILGPFLLLAADSNEKTVFMEEMDCTQQSNTNDCGVHVICNTDGLCQKFLLGNTKSLSQIVPLKVVLAARGKLKMLIDSLK